MAGNGRWLTTKKNIIMGNEKPPAVGGLLCMTLLGIQCSSGKKHDGGLDHVFRRDDGGERIFRPVSSQTRRGKADVVTVNT